MKLDLWKWEILQNIFSPNLCLIVTATGGRGDWWWHIISDSMIALADYLIPALLIYFVSQEQHLQVKSIFM